MIFDYPFILTAFVVFLPLFVLDIIRVKKRQKLPKELEKKLFISAILFRLFLAFSIIALSSPRWGIGYAPAEYRRGLDVVFAIDVSRSMDIDDVPIGIGLQTRLERGLAIAHESTIFVSGARFAAAIGRSRGYLAVPLTYDNETIQIFFESINAASMTGRSTNLEALVETAINAFQYTSPARKVIVLISDGESHVGILNNAVNRCINDNIMVVSVAVGSDEGRQIQANLFDNLPESYSDSQKNEQIISRRNTIVMRSAAERTGGIYIDGNRDNAGRMLSSHLLDLSVAQNIESADRRKEPKQRRILFIVLAIICYIGSKFVTRQLPKIFTQPPPRHTPLVLIAILSILLSSCSEGRLILLEANYLHSRGRYDEALVLYQKALNYEDSAPYAEYGLGLTFYSLDENEAAINRYSDSQKLLRSYPNNEHRELRYRNYYNTGIILFEEGDYHSAADAFKEALKTDPEKIEAKRNLELSLISISMEARMQNRTDNQQEQREIVFEYLKEEEQQLWKSREWAPEEDFTGLDY
ncbi:MAG: VWA domain-containing protein [Treponema sp.]|nr:VWA domain-containing protein [Treponema sp.]